MQTTDVALDSTGELTFREGDFYDQPSDMQHITHILDAAKGHFRRFPLCGANMFEMTKALASPQNAEFMRKRVELQLRMDGYTIQNIAVYAQNGKLTLQLKINN